MLKNMFVKRHTCLSGILLALSMLLVQSEQIGASIGWQATNEGEEVKRLISVLRDEQLREQEPQQVTRAIERLGELKATIAIDDLVQLLTFRHRFEWEDGSKVNIQMWQFPYYPSITALSQIGKPALSALIKVVGENEQGSFGKEIKLDRVFENNQDNSLASDNAISAILGIFRENPTKAVNHLKKAAKKASTGEAEQRLLEAAERVEEFVKKLNR